MTHATIATEIGDIEVELYTRAPRRRPRTSSTSPRRASTTTSIFHRVIPGFVIQGGDGEHGKKASLDAGAWAPAGRATSSRTSRSRATTSAGALAMANSGPNTNGSQFFICTDDLTGRLPEELHAVRPGDQGHGRRGQDRRRRRATRRDLPDEPVAMTKVTVAEE